MGLRKDTVNTITTLLNGITITLTARDGTTYGNGRKLTAVNTLIDALHTPIVQYPKISIVATPQTIETGMLGYTMDSTYRIAMFGYVCRGDANESLFDAAEDVIEKIVQTLSDWTNVQTMLNVGFSVVEIGPILNEQFDEAGQVAYISIPVSVQFVEH